MDRARASRPSPNSRPEPCSSGPCASTLLGSHERTLLDQIVRHLLEHVLEHQIRIEARPLIERAVGHGLLPTRCDRRLEFGTQGLMALLRPGALLDEVLFQ